MLAGYEPFGIAAEVDVDTIAVDPLDDARSQGHGPVLVLVDHLRPLGLAHFLHDYLFGRLGGDAAEGDRLHRHLHVTVHLRSGIDVPCVFEPQLTLRHFQLRGIVGEHLPAAEGVVLAGLAIDRHAHVDVLAVLAARRRGERGFERLEDDFPGDALLVRDRLDYFKDLPVHVCLFRPRGRRQATSRASMRVHIELYVQEFLPSMEVCK